MSNVIKCTDCNTKYIQFLKALNTFKNFNTFKYNKYKRHIFESDNDENKAKAYRGKCKGCGKTLKFKFRDNILERQSISFMLNGQSYAGKSRLKSLFDEK